MYTLSWIYSINTDGSATGRLLHCFSSPIGGWLQTGAPFGEGQSGQSLKPPHCSFGSIIEHVSEPEEIGWDPAGRGILSKQLCKHVVNTFVLIF
jgi:hypothetical protein